MTPEDRDKQREALAKEEQEAKEARMRGVVEPMLDGKAMDVVDQIALISAIAKKASKQNIRVTVFKDGKLTAIEEPVGDEEDIFREGLRQTGVFGKLKLGGDR